MGRDVRRFLRWKGPFLLTIIFLPDRRSSPDFTRIINFVMEIITQGASVYAFVRSFDSAPGNQNDRIADFGETGL
jgi:hypothetical protein